MKFLIVFAAVLAFAAAEVEFDFANARPIEDFPFFQERFPQFKRVGSGTGSRIVGGEIAQPGQFPYQVRDSLVQIQGQGHNQSVCSYNQRLLF